MRTILTTVVMSVVLSQRCSFMQSEVRISSNEALSDEAAAATKFRGLVAAWHHKDCFFLRCAAEEWDIKSYKDLDVCVSPL